MHADQPQRHLLLHLLATEHLAQRRNDDGGMKGQYFRNEHSPQPAENDESNHLLSATDPVLISLNK
jgi:hypothetical protein